jgi:hypothetical protein
MSISLKDALANLANDLQGETAGKNSVVSLRYDRDKDELVARASIRMGGWPDDGAYESKLFRVEGRADTPALAFIRLHDALQDAAIEHFGDNFVDWGGLGAGEIAAVER